MAIIDLDSHLRDGWLLDEIYRLPEPFAKFSPRRIGDGKYFYSKFEHDLSPMEDPVANANFKKPVTHQVFYNPEANQRGNEVMQWQQGGYDMEYRMKDNAPRRHRLSANLSDSDRHTVAKSRRTGSGGRARL